MIDIRKLKELVRLMVENDLTEMDLRDSQEQVTLHRPSPNEPPRMIFPGGGVPGLAAGTAPVAAATAAQPKPRTAAVTSSAADDDAGAGDGEGADDDSGLKSIDSPMVGTFYTAQNPDAPPFVSVGSRVKPDTVVCLVEAMKIFNEIKAECNGIVRKVLVKNGQPVEFGQKLFLIEEDA